MSIKCFRACLHGGGVPQIGEVTTFHVNVIKLILRLYGQAGYLTYLGSPTSMEIGL